MKKIRGLKYLSYEERLREMGCSALRREETSSMPVTALLLPASVPIRHQLLPWLHLNREIQDLRSLLFISREVAYGSELQNPP